MRDFFSPVSRGDGVGSTFTILAVRLSDTSESDPSLRIPYEKPQVKIMCFPYVETHDAIMTFSD
jgi:hypothetical protein